MNIKRITLTPIFKYNKFSNVVINNPTKEQAESFLKEQIEALSKFRTSEPISKAERQARRRNYKSLPQALRDLIPEDVFCSKSK